MSLLRPSTSCFPLLLLLAALAFLRPSSADPPAPAATVLNGADLDTFAVGQMTRQGLIGLSLAVVQDGQITATKYYGLASREIGQPVGPDTSFAVGSVTKQFTAACIFLLAEDGKLSVHDPVAKYFPTLTRASDITLVDLLNHVSGYRDYYPLDFVDARMAEPTMPDVVISQYATKPLDFDPGSRWSYSNTGYLILGRIIEKVSGQTFSAFLKSRLFTPLGLTHTQIGPPSDTANTAQGYTRFALMGPARAPREASGWLGAAGALYSTPTDLAKWDIALMGGKILKPASLALMTTARVLSSGQSDGYGAGLFVRASRGQAVWSHGGAVSGFLTENEMVPSSRSAVVVTVNADYADPGVLVHHVEPFLLAPTASQSVPVVNGPPAEDVARGLIAAIEKGQLDRDALGAAYSAYLTPEKLRAAAQSLKGWGEPNRVQTVDTSERGGMEVSALLLSFDKGVLRALLYRTPDAKIQEFLLTPG